MTRGAALGIALALVTWTRAAAADCPGGAFTRFIPLAVWSTSPNAGNTYGAMPVILHVCRSDGHTVWLLAPSLTWNSVIHGTATLRFYAYPDADSTLSVIAGASMRVNRRLVASWQHLPRDEGAWTDEVLVRAERDVFARFFGLGYRSREAGESSYTMARELVTARRGVNLIGPFNLGLTAAFRHDTVEDRGVPGLPLTSEAYPGVPGLGGATVLAEGFDLRYDTRDGGDYAQAGMRLTASLSLVEGLRHAPWFVRGGLEGRWLVPEAAWTDTAARVLYEGMSAPDAPFYLQSTLGGPFLLRGFTEGRFVASQAWTAEVEQRFRVWSVGLLGVVVDWHVDPFVTVGQVFDHVSDAVARPRIAAGVGLRVFVHPNLVGRIDLASGGEGLKTYVEIGYPF